MAVRDPSLCLVEDAVTSTADRTTTLTTVRMLAELPAIPAAAVALGLSAAPALEPSAAAALVPPTTATEAATAAVPGL